MNEDEPMLERAEHRNTAQCCDECHFPAKSLCNHKGKHVCYSCVLISEGRPDYENHHVLGRDYPDTVVLWGNLHRDITTPQQKWPEVLKYPDNPLLVIAAILRSVGDFAAWLAQHCERISDWLIALWRVLDEQFPGWQQKLPPLWRTV